MQISQACREFLLGYFATNERREKTITAYHSDIRQFRKFIGEKLDVKTLNGAHIEAWATHLRDAGYSPASIRRKIVVLKVFCGYWVRKGVLHESPFWRVKISYGRIEQLPRTLTENEISRLLNEAKGACRSNGSAVVNVQNPDSGFLSTKYRSLRNLALIELLFATGMRVGEVSSIDFDDFSISEAIFKIKGKGGRERLAFVVDETALSIQKEHLEARKSLKIDGKALFLNAAGNRLSTQGIASILTSMRKNSGIERHITPHMLRHTVATMLLRNGVDIRVVQEFLGHASIATTQRYTHISKEHMVNELKKRHPSLDFRS